MSVEPPRDKRASLAELAAVRTVDPLEVRKPEFSPRELSRVFSPHRGPDGAC
jgi:hypothetical protein